MKKIILLIFLLINSIIFTNDKIKFSSNSVEQGKFIIVKYPKEKNYDIVFNNSKIKIKSFLYKGKNVALIPVHYSTPEGVYTIKIYENNRDIISKKIKVLDGNFEKSYITVSNTMKKKRSSKNMAVMTNYTAEAKSNSINRKLWKGKFIYPVKDKKYKKISSPFGSTRYVNGKVVGYHSGIDFPVPIGTPLRAANNGKVVLAQKLTTTGNTIIIDHGMNVFSAYAHMSKLSVKKGDIVKKGQFIGKSGNTGFTTGPHLHFTISIGTTFVNPEIFIKNRIL